MRIPTPFIFRKSLLLAIFAILLATAGQAATLGVYNGVVTPQAEGVDFDPLTGSTITLVDGTDSRGWTSNNAINLTYYISLKLRSESGYQISLTQLSGRFKAGSLGPGMISAAVFIDNVLQEQVGTYSPRYSDPIEVIFDFSDLTGIQASNEVEFRIYGWGADRRYYNDVSAIMTLDDLTVSGEVTAVPEPASYAALAGALALVGAMWRRRGRVTHGI